MTAKKKVNDDFEDRYFDLLETNFSELKQDIKEIKQDTKKIPAIEARVRNVEKEVFPASKETVQQLPPLWRDPQIIKLLTILGVGGILILVIYAGLKGIALPKGIF